MTPFSLLRGLAGLSLAEAAEVLGVRLDSAKSWSSGRSACPEGALADLKSLIASQERAAAEALAMMREQAARFSPGAIEIGAPREDAEAQRLGWPCVGAWGGMAARVIAAAPVPVKLVPRNATP